MKKRVQKEMRNAIKNEPINRLSTKLYMKFTR